MWYQFWTGAWWLQVWPNLAANCVWVPVAYIHHRKVMGKMAEHSAKMLRQQRLVTISDRRPHEE